MAVQADATDRQRHRCGSEGVICADGEAVPLKTWIVVGGALVGAFLAALDIQITNTALPYIEGSIATGGAYGTWISTA